MRQVAALAVALLFAAGCGSSPAPPARSHTSGPASASSTAWMANFCAVAADLRTALWGSAADPGPGDPAALRLAFGDQLSGAADALQAAADRLDGLPANPPAGATEAASELDDQLATLGGTVRTGQQSLDALPPAASEADLGEVMGTVWPSVARRAAQPFDEVPISPDMKVAAAGDPTCRSLPGLR